MSPQKGLIPAGAGRTPMVCRRATSPWAHPRRCGAHSWMRISSRFSRGSSPQVRGARVCGAFLARLGGLIPAGAGRTRVMRRSDRWWPAHPRRCGAHPVHVYVRPTQSGSSPQVRGARSLWWLASFARRLIPAGAGRTAGLDAHDAQRRAHPRRCGAHRCPRFLSRFGIGSSPQVRGARGRHGLVDVVTRLIPAGAGRTQDRLQAGPEAWAHPRRCGAHGLWEEKGDGYQGSSPQVRGALTTAEVNPQARRLIPAGAGRTTLGTLGASGARAHPRRCGAHLLLVVVALLEHGSSPQVRGAQLTISDLEAAVRLIPAGAGRTCESSSRED